MIKRAAIFLWLSFSINLLAFDAGAQMPALTFRGPDTAVKVYDFAEVAIEVKHTSAANPFTDVAVTGEFCREAGEPVQVEGFCDSVDGHLFRIRFMPSVPGRYNYSVIFRQGSEETSHKGSFSAIPGRRSGILRVDAKYPEHFVWEGSGEH